MEPVIRVQTALRLTPELYSRVKKQARKEHRSFNSFVEHILSLAVDWELPIMDMSEPISEEIRSLCASGYTRPTPEELAADPKLANLVEKFGV